MWPNMIHIDLCISRAINGVRSFGITINAPSASLSSPFYPAHHRYLSLRWHNLWVVQFLQCSSCLPAPPWRWRPTTWWTSARSRTGKPTRPRRFWLLGRPPAGRESRRRWSFRPAGSWWARLSLRAPARTPAWRWSSRGPSWLLLVTATSRSGLRWSTSKVCPSMAERWMGEGRRYGPARRLAGAAPTVLR